MVNGDAPSREFVKSALAALTAKTERVGKKVGAALKVADAEYDKKFAGVTITEAMTLEVAVKIKPMPVLTDSMILSEDFWKEQVAKMTGDVSQLSQLHRTGYAISSLTADKEFNDSYSFGTENDFLTAVLSVLGTKVPERADKEDQKQEAGSGLTSDICFKDSHRI